MTAGISPGLAAMCSTGMAAPVTLRAAAMMSFTVTDSPAPMMVEPVARLRQARSSADTMSSTWIRSRIWVPSPYTCTP